jgi:hypothetical protein
MDEIVGDVEQVNPPGEDDEIRLPLAEGVEDGVFAGSPLPRREGGSGGGGMG